MKYMLKNVFSFSRRIWGNQESDAYERGDAVLAWWDPELQFEFVMIFDTHHKTKILII